MVRRTPINSTVICITHGEPDAGKLARPVRREAYGNLSRQRYKAPYAYSTRNLVAQKYDSSVRSVKLFYMTVRLYTIRPDLLFCQQ